MRPPLSQTSVLLLVTVAVIAALGTVIDLASTHPVAGPTDSPRVTRPWREVIDETIPEWDAPEMEAPADVAVDEPADTDGMHWDPVTFRVKPRELAWIASLPHAEDYTVVRLPSASGDLSLAWDYEDLGVAKDDRGQPDEDGRHLNAYTLDLRWSGSAAPPLRVALERSFGYPHVVADTYCERLGWTYTDDNELAATADDAGAQSELPELSRFAEGTIRGDETYRVLATPHAIYVIEQDTSPLDWIHDCHEVRQGPFTECVETRWELSAELVVDLPAEISGSESVPVDCSEAEMPFRAVPPWSQVR